MQGRDQWTDQNKCVDQQPDICKREKIYHRNKKAGGAVRAWMQGPELGLDQNRCRGKPTNGEIRREALIKSSWQSIKSDTFPPPPP